jgi:hypothetical protein
MTLINTYDQLRCAVNSGTITEKHAVACSYHRRPTGRIGWCQINQTLVSSPFFKAINGAPSWYGGYPRIFSGPKSTSLTEAQAWASKQYGITEWARNSLGDYVPAVVNKAHPVPKRKRTEAK